MPGAQMPDAQLPIADRNGCVVRRWFSLFEILARVALVNLPVFADNAAARAGDLKVGQYYRDPVGFVRMVI